LVNAFLGFTVNRTLFQSSLKPLASFQKGFIKIPEMFHPKGRKGLKFKRE
jgi:hypothetical protein